MAGLKNIRQIGAANDEGRSHWCAFRKVPSQATTAGGWADLSMAAGNPVPNYYAATPLQAQTLESFSGIFHGDAKAPYSKHLLAMSCVTPTTNMLGQAILCDYLLYYPFLDGDAAGEVQTLGNATTLPRYTDGDGIMAMAVAVAPTTGGGSFSFNYVDAAGNAKTSPVISANTAVTNIASLLTSDPSVGGGPFLPLAAGSTGVRSITDVTVASAMGGLFALVLVKPLATNVTREVNTAHEIEFVTMKPGAPRIYDGAYLNWLINGVAGSIATGTFTGNCRFVWST